MHSEIIDNILANRDITFWGTENNIGMSWKTGQMVFLNYKKSLPIKGKSDLGDSKKNKNTKTVKEVKILLRR